MIPSINAIPSRSFTPERIGGLQLWLDSDLSTYTLNTSTVSNVASKVGSRNAAQSTVLKQPAYISSSLNSRIAFQTDRVNDELVVFDSTLADTMASTSKTVFVLFTPKNITATQRIIQTRNSGGGTGINITIDTASSWYVFSQAGTTALTTSVAAVVDTPVLLCMHVNGSTATYYINGTQVGQRTTATTYTKNADNAVRFGTFDGTQFPSNGDYSEVVIYTGALSTEDRIRVEQYIGKKYATF